MGAGQVGRGSSVRYLLSMPTDRQCSPQERKELGQFHFPFTNAGTPQILRQSWILISRVPTPPPPPRGPPPNPSHSRPLPPLTIGNTPVPTPEPPQPYSPEPLAAHKERSRINVSIGTRIATQPTSQAPTRLYSTHRLPTVMPEVTRNRCDRKLHHPELV